jgi:DNA invertase Pin-like site-specific DNA recombinase
MKGQRIGYVRVSAFDQNVDRQLEGLALDKIFTDKASGKDVNRPQLEAMLSFIREGDTAVVHSMDRLARNLDDLRKLVQLLTKWRIRIEFVKESLVFTGKGPHGQPDAIARDLGISRETLYQYLRLAA